jgi:hypothetical protein
MTSIDGQVDMALLQKIEMDVISEKFNQVQCDLSVNLVIYNK